MDDTRPSKLQRLTLWVAWLLTIGLVIFGVWRYDPALDVRERFWHDLFGRWGGPMTFRFFLQPTMALLAAIPDGRRDARQGRHYFFWNSPGDPTLRRGRLREGLYATARILLLGLSMDLIYQYKVFDQFYPVEAVLIALLLAVVPYFVWRPLVEWIVRVWTRRHPGNPVHHAR